MYKQIKKSVRVLMLLGVLGVAAEGLASAGTPAAVAYLFDSEGDVFVIRSGATNRANSSCITLCALDAVILPAGASARVIFPSSMYELADAGIYLIQGSGNVAVQKDSGEAKALLSMRGARGSGNPLLGDVGDADLVLPPTDLFAYVKPPVFRQGKDVTEVELLSPRGQMLSTTPFIAWHGGSNSTYEVSLVVVGKEEESAARFPWVQVEASSLSWEKTGWPPLKHGDLCRIKIRRGDSLLTGQDTCFFVLEQDVADKIKDALPNGDSTACLFMEASLLLNPNLECVAEARILASKLVSLEPENPVYLRLLKRCYVLLGFEKEASAVQKKILQYEGDRP